MNSLDKEDAIKKKIQEELDMFVKLKEDKRAEVRSEVVERIFDNVIRSWSRVDYPSLVGEKILKLSNDQINLPLRQLAKLIGLDHPYSTSYHLKKLVSSGRLDIIRGKYTKSEII